MIDVCVVIVTMNHISCVKACIDSVIRSRCHCSVKLVVVDDGSVDGTRELLDTFSDELTLIVRDGGHSYSNNNNIVLQSVEAKYFLSLNPDTILPVNGIQHFIDFMEVHINVGACGPKLVNPDGSLQLSCRRFPTPSTFVLRRTPLRYLFPTKHRGKRHLMTNWEHDKIQEVDWFLGACIMFRAEALSHVGYFDERFRLYCEDIDICYRLWEIGWSIYYNPDIEVVHDHRAKSDKNLLSRHSLWHYQSMLRYVGKHGLAGFKRPTQKKVY